MEYPIFNDISIKEAMFLKFRSDNPWNAYLNSIKFVFDSKDLTHSIF
jgi:hypothetical protein